MFGVSTRIRYGLRALIHIAEKSGKDPIPLHTIAERENISMKYLENIFKLLKKNGIVAAVRGPVGGYILNPSPEELTVYDVVNAVEGPPSTIDCIENPLLCKNTEECINHELWKELQDHIVEFLRSKTLSQLLAAHINQRMVS